MAAKIEYTPVSEISGIVQTVKDGFMTFKTRPLEYRINQIKQLGLMVQDNEAAFQAALYADLGRPALESFSCEIFVIKNDIAEMIHKLPKWAKPVKADTDLIWSAAGPKVYREPKGTVLILGTWNYPITLLLAPLLGAIAGGNTAIIKPAEQAINMANLVTKLIPRYLDQAAYRVVNGAVEETTELLKIKFDHIFYTGSGTVGKIIAVAAAKQLTPVTLELGGKSPTIVFEDANLKIAARRIMWGKVVNAAQTCIAPDYIMVHESIKDKLINEIKNVMDAFYPAKNPPQLETDGYSALIHERHFERIKGMINDTKGRIVLGGRTNEKNRKIETTVVTDLKSDDVLMQSEIFGPILPILTFNHRDQVVQKVNEGDYPLAMYVFTNSAANRDYIFERTRSGQFVHNDTLIQFIVPGLPFGGTGASGTGNYHGKASFDCFTHERAYASVPGWFEALIAARYPPYTSSNLGMLRTFTAKSLTYERPRPIGTNGAGPAYVAPTFLSKLVRTIRGSGLIKLLLLLIGTYSALNVRSKL
ncbi:uncharacterized protein L969DRAFT_19014 [Mixia osmundae IAM 14324]|uniref:Aldehyde dehydrogenase n=1 Tax=Mixia osmundae (strain CBS 9802 / IAM 14324 / JCM 22182 / KY 12970) TaxID=764103 RepID=G7DS51_MIXOS|nr:uncharacterized protein L969DRAFT_19014 [Mixia osmundae IAM 14324]KEI37534.1 hypothetical protein L969DRAFT_19014 [Mixia osmundae IAM 14324]GAA93411.1 hypothetical protein E5Q_00052 [Mixia osmundae IAM 14324]